MALFIINIQMDTYICLGVHRVLYAADWNVLINHLQPSNASVVITRHTGRYISILTLWLRQ